MPLSDEEARLLQQLEQSLAAEDPEFASTLRGSKQRAHNRRIAVFAVLGFIVGLGVLFTGAVYAQTIVGVIGFLAMLVGAYFFVTAWRKGFGGSQESGAPGPKAKPSAGSFVDRMEERWQRRREGDDF